MPGHLSVLDLDACTIVLGLLLGFAAVIGDLAESIIKRSTGVKDSGNMLPGIGGALDLIDSLLFTAPLLFFYLRLVDSRAVDADRICGFSGLGILQSRSSCNPA